MNIKKQVITLGFITIFAMANTTFGVIGGLLETAGNTVVGAGQVAAGTAKGVGRSFAQPKALPDKPIRWKEKGTKYYYEEEGNDNNNNDDDEEEMEMIYTTQSTNKLDDNN